MNNAPGRGEPSGMQALRAQFVQRCILDRRMFEAWLRSRDNGGALADPESVRRLAHRLAGAAAVFDYGELSRAAQALEDALNGVADGRDASAHCGSVMALIDGLGA